MTKRVVRQNDKKDDLLEEALVSGVRTGGGFRGSKPPPLKILKEMKTSLFGTNRLFSEIAEIALMFFCAIQLAYKILKNFHCDAIIDLLIVKLCLCAALDVGDCRNTELKPFLFLRQNRFYAP